MVLSSAGGTPITPSPTENAPVEETPIEDVPVEDVAAEEDAEPLPPVEEAPAAADAGPSLDDAPLPPVDDAAAPAADPAPADAETEPKAKAATKRKAKAATKDEKPSAAEAAGLPRIDHVWVIGIGAPLAALEGDYAADVLLARGTELPKYTPVSTDPALGAAALVAGQAPSPDASTIVEQLTAKQSWRAYAPGAPNCTDAPNGNPLLSFLSVTSAPDCADRVARLDALTEDLDAPPAFSYVATDPAIDPAGLEAQLKQVVEPIRRSAAFKKAGLIAIVPTAANPIAPTGALVLSPFAEGSTSVAKAYGPYSLLRTFSDLLGIDPPGEAAGKDVKGLGRDVLAPKD